MISIRHIIVLAALAFVLVTGVLGNAHAAGTDSHDEGPCAVCTLVSANEDDDSERVGTPDDLPDLTFGSVIPAALILTSAQPATTEFDNSAPFCAGYILVQRNSRAPPAPNF